MPERLIDANALKKTIREQKWKHDTKVDLALDWIYMLIDEAPTVDAVRVVHGKWVKSDDYKGWLVCSACRGCYVDNAWVNGKKWRYCPNCGAKMDKEDDRVR